MSGSAPKVSILIPVWNRERYIEPCVRSALTQTLADIEIVICDNASTDGTLAVCERLAAEDSRIRLFRNATNLGPVANWRRCMDEARAPVGKILFSDDTLAPDYLEKTLPWLDDPTVGFVYTAVRIGTDAEEMAGGQVYYRAFPQTGVVNAACFVEEALSGADRVPVSPGAGLFRLADLKRHLVTELPGSGIHDFAAHGAGPDLMLYLKTAAFYRNIAYVDEPLAFFRAHADSITIGDRAGKVRRCHQAARGWFRERVWNQGRGALPEGPEILLSALVSTCNSASFLRGCLDDLLAQTLADRMEILVIDSGSNEDEGAIVAEYQSRHSRIRYLRTERETIYAAWNRGIAMAQGKYLTNANTDDRHRRDACERLVAALEKNPDVALAWADQIVTDTPHETFDACHPVARFRWPPFDAQRLFSVCSIGPQPVWRRALHQGHGMFDAELTVAGDYEFWLRIAPHERFMHLDLVLGLYLRNRGGAEYRDPERAGRETQDARVRHWPAAWGALPAPGRHFLVAYRNGEEWEEPEPMAVTTRPRASVIIATKDRPELLGDALASLVAQTCADWEAIVVNDGGVPCEGAVREADPRGRIRYVSLPRSTGQVAARNLAIRLASAEVVMFLDDDDLYEPQHIATLLAAMEASRAPFVYSNTMVAEERIDNGVRQILSRSGAYPHQEFSFDRLRVENYIPINTWAVRRDCLDAVGCFDEGLPSLEDWELLLRLASRFRFHHENVATCEVRIRRDVADNVSRRRRATYLDTFRAIYAKHPVPEASPLALQREQVLSALQRDASAGGTITATEDPYTRWIAQQSLTEADAERMAERMITRWPTRPTFQLVCMLDPAEVALLADTLDSLKAQMYPAWGLSVISAEACPVPGLDALPMVEWRMAAGDPMDEARAAIAEAGCDFVALLNPGDRLAPEALFAIADHAVVQRDWQAIYADDDEIAGDGRARPRLKPEFDPEFLRATDYIGLGFFRRAALEGCGGFRWLREVATYDALLRVYEQHGASAIGHVSRVLAHRRPCEWTGEVVQAIESVGRLAVTEHLARTGTDAVVGEGLKPLTWRVQYRRPHDPLVSIVIPFRERGAQLGECVESLFARTAYANFEVMLAGCMDQDHATRWAVEDLVERHGERLRVVEAGPGASTALACNLGVAHARGEVVALLSGAVRVVQPQWLERLLAQALRADVGAVSGRLVGAENRIRDAGGVLGFGGIAGSPWAGFATDQTDTLHRPLVDRSCTVLAGDCLVLRRACWESVEGLDAQRFPERLWDADLCLRLTRRGLRLIQTPYATLAWADAAASGRPTPAERAAWLDTHAAELKYDACWHRGLSITSHGGVPETAYDQHWDAGVHDRPRVLGFPVNGSGCGEYRVLGPLGALAGSTRIEYGLVPPFDMVAAPRIPSFAEIARLDPDVLLLQSTVHEGHLDLLRELKGRHRAFRVCDLEDLKTWVPDSNSRKAALFPHMAKRLRELLAACDRLTVTTAALAEHHRKDIADIRIVPNRLSRTRWGALRSQRRRGDKPRIGWVGAQQHHGDLALLAEVVRATAQEADWVFFGMCLDALRPHVAEVHDFVPYEHYPEKMASLDLDLAVAPLEIHPFNVCKSNLRLIEYGALGWPVVCSDIEPYREGRPPVCRVANEPAAWIEALRARLHDLDAAAREGDALKRWVERGYFLEDHLDDWLEALTPEGRQAAMASHAAMSR